MRGTVGEFLIERLLSSGIDTVFGIPGDYTLKFYNNLYKSKLEVVGTTTELAAGYAADAYARVKGLGCVCVTYCVGGFSVANAVACAYAEKSPVIIISGSPGMKERDDKVLLHHMVGHFECQHKMYEQITCANTVLRDPERAGYEIDRVLTAAQEYKQPVYIELPRDMVDKPIRYDPYTLLTPQEAKTDVQNLEESIAEVSTWIAGAKNPVIWAGVECARFGIAKKLIKFAEQTNIPIATTILGKSVVNERHPLSLGVYCESTATDEMRKFMDSCDCLIMLGVMMTDMNTGFLPLKYQKRNIINATSKELQIRNHSYKDVKFTDFTEALFKCKIEKREKVNFPVKQDVPFVVQPAKKITSSRVFEKINNILDSNMAIIADVGDSLFGALDLTVHDSHHFISDAFYTNNDYRTYTRFSKLYT
jgi:indolepyruvate decarboxylase